MKKNLNVLQASGAGVVVAAGPLLAASCFDIVQAWNDIPIPCTAADIGAPCNLCTELLWTIVDGTQCAEPMSLLPPRQVVCLRGEIEASQIGCFCNPDPNQPSVVPNSEIVCAKACTGSTPGGPSE